MGAKDQGLAASVARGAVQTLRGGQVIGARSPRLAEHEGPGAERLFHGPERIGAGAGVHADQTRRIQARARQPIGTRRPEIQSRIAPRPHPDPQAISRQIGQPARRKGIDRRRIKILRRTHVMQASFGAKRR